MELTAEGSGSGAWKLSPARLWAWRVLQRVERDGAYLDRVLEAVLRRSGLAPADRALLTELVHGVVRWKKRLDFIIQAFARHALQRYPLPLLTALRLGVYQLLFLERIPAYAAVDQTVELVKPLGKGAAGLVNAILRALLRSRQRLPEPPAEDVVSFLATVHSYPEWLVRRWVERFGVEEAAQLLEAQNRRPVISLRVNPQRMTADGLVAWLHERGVAAERSAYSDVCVLVERLSHELLQEILQQGWASVQDVSAVLVVELAAVQPGMEVVDLCGAPGGKACALAERLGGQGRITVVDIHAHRLRLVEREAQRLGVRGVMELVVADARQFQHREVDLVLLDAPCSGLGTLAKKPDIKWRRRQEDIPALAQLQRSLLQNAARLVRPGGVLLYSTCTTEPEENEQVVEEFLRCHPEFSLEAAQRWLPEAVCRDGFLQTLPHRHHGCDGAFAARLRRVGRQEANFEV